MIKKPTLDIQDEVVREHVESLQAESQGTVLELDAAPLAATPLIQDTEWGIYSNSLYIRQGMTIYVFASDSQITAT